MDGYRYLCSVYKVYIILKTLPVEGFVSVSTDGIPAFGVLTAFQPCVRKAPHFCVHYIPLYFLLGPFV